MSAAAPVWRNLRVPAALLDGFEPQGRPGADLVRVDLALRNGCFQPAPPDVVGLDMGGRILLPGFVDMHVHLDKTYTVERTGFSQSGLGHAIDLSMTDLPHRTVDDLIARMERGLRAAEAHGTVALRTHLDTMHLPDESPAWIAFDEVNRAWRGRLGLQAVALMALHRVDEPEFARRCAQVAARGGVLGAFVQTGAQTGGAQAARLDRFLTLATEHGLDLDLHLDETTDPDADGLLQLLDALARTGFRGRVVAGHCCALAQKPEAEREALIARLAEAGVHVVSLPLSNGFLQDRRPGRTKRLVGLAPVQELRAGGVPVAFASDNVRDAFYPYGTYDMLEVLRAGVFLGQLEARPGDWVRAVTDLPAAAMGLPEAGRIRAGGPADGILFDAKTWADLFSGTGLGRTVLRAGRAVTGQIDLKTKELA